MSTPSLSILFVVLISVTMLPTAAAGELFLDTFEDGDFTDDMPVSWVAPDYAATGSRSIQNGNFVIERTGRQTALDTDVAENVYGDVSIRTLARTNSETGFGLFVASTLSGPVDGAGRRQIWALIEGNGFLQAGTVVDNDVKALRQLQMPWDPTGRDVNLKLDYFDNVVEFSAWLEGTDEPANPHLTFNVTNTPDLPDEGRIGIWIWNPSSGELGPVEFREVEVIPEPGGVLLLATGLIAVAVCRRRFQP